MGFFTETAKEFAKRYVQERGVEGTLADAGDLIQGAAKMGKKIFGGSDDDYEESYEDYDYEDSSQNFFDEDTWKSLCEKLNASKDAGDYDGALRILSDYYSRYDVERDYWYQNWKADIMIAKFRDVGDRPVSKDLKLKQDIGNILLYCKGREDESKEATKELDDMFEEAKRHVSWYRDFDSFYDELNELRDPEQVKYGSKLKDIEKAFSLLNNFKSKYRDEVEENIFYFKAYIYNALFAALAMRPQELKSLTDSQLTSYFADAEESANKSLEMCGEDEDKSQEEFYQKRIPEQINELKQLRFGKVSSSSVNSHLEVDENEQEYLDELKACLKDDGEISDRERRLLDRLRKSLGISEKRAAALEASLSSLSDEEKEYLEELRECMENGSISNSERRLLDRLRKSLGISEARAKELESSL